MSENGSPGIVVDEEEDGKSSGHSSAASHDTRIEQAEARTEFAITRTQLAEMRTDEATNRTREAEARTDETTNRSQNAEARTNEAIARADEANARADEANTRADEANTRADETNTRAEQAEAQSEHAIRASELRYRRLFETAPDGILILDSDTGQVVDANPFMKDLLGYSQEEFLGRKLWEIGTF